MALFNIKGEKINVDPDWMDESLTDSTKAAPAKIVGDKTNLNTTVKNFFNLMRTGKVYTVKFPLWETSQTSNGEKLDDNAGLVCLPSTAAEHRQDDYENIPLFRTYDCNAHVTEDGVRIIDALKGNANFEDTGENDVFVLGMSYYEKYWVEDGYWYYSRTDLPRDGYTLAVECQKKDGSDQGFAVYGKYVTGLVNGNLYSSKGLIPARYCAGRSDDLSRSISYNRNVTEFKKRGTYYTGGMLCDYKYIMTTFYLMFATLNSQSIMAGCTSYNNQYVTAVAEENTNRIVLTNVQAANFIVGGYVSIGDNGSSTSAPDRNILACHNKAECVKVLAKETYDDSNTAIVVDATFTTTTTTWISTFHWRSGYSDFVNGRTGSPCPDTSGLTNGKYPMLLNGIELMVGGYEVGSNAIMDIVDAAGTRDIYLTNDATKLTTDVTTAKSTYTKLEESIHPTTLSAWNHITAMTIDVTNGAMTIESAGETNSGSSTGFADGLYVDVASSGQREFLLLGNLWYGSHCGLACLLAASGLGDAYWAVLARLSINAIGVNRAA